MSIQAVAWAIKVRVGDPALKCLLIAISNYADEDGEAFPSLERLAFDTEISKRTVQRKLIELQTMGLLEITQRTRANGTRTSSLFKLLRTPADTSGQIGTLIDPVAKTGGEPVAKTAQPVDSKVAMPDPSLKNHQRSVTVDPCARETAAQTAGKIFDDEFWSAYPDREGNNPKKPAREKFVRKVISGENPNDMVAGARRLAEYHQAKGDVGTDKVPHAVTWLNQERWKTQKGAPAGGGRKLDIFDIAAGRR